MKKLNSNRPRLPRRTAGVLLAMTIFVLGLAACGEKADEAKTGKPLRSKSGLSGR